MTPIEYISDGNGNVRVMSTTVRKNQDWAFCVAKITISIARRMIANGTRSAAYKYEGDGRGQGMKYSRSTPTSTRPM